jgi:hypothetical protein
LETATFFAAGFFAAGFFAAAGFGNTFFAAAFAAVFFTTALLGAGLAATRVVLLDALLLFTACPLLATAFDLVLTSCALAEVLPLCALAAVELRVVFAISLHRFWPWRPGVIAHVYYTSKQLLEYLYYSMPQAVLAT